jgi:hypothetical protein
MHILVKQVQKGLGEIGRFLSFHVFVPTRFGESFMTDTALRFRQGMRAGRRMILRVAITEAADPAHIVEALLECREAAIGPSAAARRLIILRFGARCGGNTDANCQ